jgi:glycosyltransferase involved in cell wall biosynthesis
MPVPDLVYNGIPIERYPFLPSSGTYLMTCGRIVPQKGHTDAIAAAGESEELVIAGKYYKNDPNMYAYWLVNIFPAIDGKRIRYVPFTREDSYRQLLSGAKALLFPIHWDEPFGLVMVEAMACGTPVIAYNRGSVAEIVKDGVTGFIVDENEGVPGLVEAIQRIGEINRAACRKHVEDHFTVEKMVEGYENVYKKTLSLQG